MSSRSHSRAQSLPGRLFHLPEFPTEYEIVAMADIAPGKAAAKLESFGLGKATAYDDPHQMLTEERLDLVTTPPSSHARSLSRSCAQV